MFYVFTFLYSTVKFKSPLSYQSCWHNSACCRTRMCSVRVPPWAGTNQSCTLKFVALMIGDELSIFKCNDSSVILSPFPPLNNLYSTADVLNFYLLNIRTSLSYSLLLKSTQLCSNLFSSLLFSCIHFTDWQSALLRNSYKQRSNSQSLFIALA
jgi:hypothetical protein